MNKLVLDNGLMFRVDKHCGITRNSMNRLLKTRQRQALFAFRKLFSHKEPIGGYICAFDSEPSSLEEDILI